MTTYIEHTITERLKSELAKEIVIDFDTSKLDELECRKQVIMDLLRQVSNYNLHETDKWVKIHNDDLIMKRDVLIHYLVCLKRRVKND